MSDTTDCSPLGCLCAMKIDPTRSKISNKRQHFPNVHHHCSRFKHPFLHSFSSELPEAARSTQRAEHTPAVDVAKIHLYWGLTHPKILLSSAWNMKWFSRKIQSGLHISDRLLQQQPQVWTSVFRTVRFTFCHFKGKFTAAHLTCHLSVSHSLTLTLKQLVCQRTDKVWESPGILADLRKTLWLSPHQKVSFQSI